MTEEEFEDFLPIKNPNGDYGWNGTLWETFGRDLEFVRSVPNENVWTLIDGDDGGQVIVSGFHVVNRVGYFVTELPWKTELHMVIE